MIAIATTIAFGEVQTSSKGAKSAPFRSEGKPIVWQSQPVDPPLFGSPALGRIWDGRMCALPWKGIPRPGRPGQTLGRLRREGPAELSQTIPGRIPEVQAGRAERPLGHGNKIQRPEARVPASTRPRRGPCLDHEQVRSDPRGEGPARAGTLVPSTTVLC